MELLSSRIIRTRRTVKRIRRERIASASKENLNIEELKNIKVCDYSKWNEQCLDGAKCKFVHGTTCPNCYRDVINPFSEEDLMNHTIECETMRLFYRGKNFSLTAESKACSICYDVVWNTETRCFGILNACWHVFCLTCIKEWREQKNDGYPRTDCPLCRIESTFVFPSPVWPLDEEEKVEIEGKYISALSNIHCKFYKFGAGYCIQGSGCFYRHQDEAEVQI